MIRTLVIISCALAAASGVAHARDGIVVEAYTGSRPANAGETLRPLVSELAARGFVTGEGVGRIFDAKVSRGAGPALPGNFAEQLKAGQRAYITGKFDDAIEKLGPLIDAAHESSGTFARNQPLREKLVDALVALAMAQQRSGDPRAARATLGELVRSFPEAQVAKATWGPEAAALFEQVRRELREASRGRLIVKLTDQSAEVFVNERFEQRGTVVKELLPGDYRVVVQQGPQQSRTHHVTVRGGVDTTVTVDLVFDALVHTSPWTGFVYETADDRERLETQHAATIGAGIGERAVVVIGIDTVRGRTAVVGSLVGVASGREQRRASLALEPPPTADRLTALGRFLAGDPASPGIDVLLDGDASVQSPDAPSLATRGSRSDGPDARGERWGGWPWITGVLGAGALGTGGYLLYLDGTCPDGSAAENCSDLYNTKTPALLALGGGAVLAAITIYLVVSADDPDPARSAFIVPTSDGAMAGVTLTW